ncbi:MAG TPA: thioredoxin-disulfide reductase [Dehalococcoidia bacterium]|nr:thioredoxin-disulfide reductase [Dehalococcoidia bacterium]
MVRYEVVVIGGGPAGLTAGMYTSRAGLKTLLLERGIFGGQIVNARRVENYPGFPEGISGLELATLMQKQAAKYGLETASAEVLAVKPEDVYLVTTSEGDFGTGAVIIAVGSEHRKLDVPGEDRLLGLGVSYCATCDGFFFRDQDVAVVGGGDTAMTDALELSQYASNVYVIHRRNQLRASQVLQQQALAQPKLKFVWDTVVVEILGESRVTGLKLRNVKTGKSFSLPVAGVFVAVGLKPNSQRFADIVKLDDTGHIITDEFMATSAPGVFACGDIRRNSVRQIASAVGDGATAALSAFRYLRERN